MDPLTFIVEISKVLAYPVGLVVAVAILREPLGDLLRSITGLRYKDLDVKFEKHLKEAAANAKELPAPPEPPALPPPSSLNQLLPVAELAPRAAVLEAYRRVEEAADQALRLVGAETPRFGAARRKLLESKGVIEGSTGALLDDLQVMRNLAAHGEDQALSLDKAITYLQLSDLVIQTINASSVGYDVQRGQRP